MSIKTLRPEDIKFLAVHCSATPPKVNATAADIDRWHRDRGFLKIGYHYVIRRDGAVEAGRPVTEFGAHVEGWNHCSLGICLVGGVDDKLKPAANFTTEQYAALAKLLRGLKESYPEAVVQGHRDFPDVAKACPSFDVKGWWAVIAAAPK